MFNLTFFINSILLGVGLAMDAFSVSLANGLEDPCMRPKKLFAISGTFSFFQALMPLIGWFLVHSLVEYFVAFEPFIPWIALALLSFIGVKMILEARESKPEEGAVCTPKRLSAAALILQGIATSIDALSVGFTISDYSPISALICALIISAVTFVICTAGVIIGKKAGTALSGKAGILGGVILILIGIEIFVTGVFNL